jgi:hypothetical protein
MEKELKNYQMIIPLSEVQSANFFDETVHEDYKRLFRPAQAASSGATTGSDG